MSKKRPRNLESLYVDAIQDAFQVVQEEYETHASERLPAQTAALRECLADCLAYQQELDRGEEEQEAIDNYGADLPDELVPLGMYHAAA